MSKRVRFADENVSPKNSFNMFGGSTLFNPKLFRTRPEPGVRSKQESDLSLNLPPQSDFTSMTFSSKPRNILDKISEFNSDTDDVDFWKVAHLTNKVNDIPLKRLLADGMLFDTEVTVGSTIFKCHRLILRLSSSYFEELIDATTAKNANSSESSDAVLHLRIEEADPNAFQAILNYIYTGNLNVEMDNFVELMDLAKRLDLTEIADACLGKISSVKTGELVKFWRQMEAAGEDGKNLALLCKVNFMTRLIGRLKEAQEYADQFTENMLVSMVDDTQLRVETETDVCEFVIRWLEVHKSEPFHLERILSSIRWCTVPKRYIDSTLLNNDIIKCYPEGVTFLERVVNFKIYGIEFTGLKSLIRPSVGFEKCLVYIGVGKTADVMSGVSLQRSGCPTLTHLKTDSIPTGMSYATSNAYNKLCHHEGIFHRSALIVTGLGECSNEIWKYEFETGWVQCSNMSFSRKGHCAAFVGTTLYIFGGRIANRLVLTSIEKYNIRADKSKPAKCHLAKAVSNASCAVHGGSVYIFGGRGKNVFQIVDHIQMYDTIKDTCVLLKQRMPRCHYNLKIVVWEDSAIMMFDKTCFVYDFNSMEWRIRREYNTDVVFSGIVLENHKVYLFGGRQNNLSTDEMCCADVRGIVFENEKRSGGWKVCGRMSTSLELSAYGVLALPTYDPV